MDFSTFLSQITPLQWSLLGLLFIAFGAQIFIYLYYYTGVIFHAKNDTKIEAENELQPAVSVIICARNESENLEHFLPLVLEQNYPNYEVIVVNDGSSDETEMLLARLKLLYPHLRDTYTPDNTDVISRKKLALTIGIKSAQNELLLFTDADCRPTSTEWISEMVRHFSPETEFVLGYGGYLPRKTLLSRLISYDTLFIAMQYLGFAQRGKPYMGVGRNLAYRRSTFFANRGFAGSLHIASGDDDLLVNKFANQNNTRIATTAKSTTLSVPKATFGEWFHQKERHLTTAPFYSSESKKNVTLEPTTRGAFYALLCAVLCLWDPLTACVALTLFLIRYIVQLIIINKTADCLKERRFYTTILIFDLFLPLVTLVLLLFGKKKTAHWK